MTPQGQLAEFIRTARAAGSADDAVRASLMSAGWTAPDVEAAFVALSAPAVSLPEVSGTPKETKPPFRLPWKWIIIGAGILVVAVSATLAFTFFSKKSAPVVVPAANLPKTVSNQPQSLPPKEGIAVGEPNPSGSSNTNTNTNADDVANTNAGSGASSVSGKDDTALNDSDMSPKPVSISLEQNAYVDPEKVQDYSGWSDKWAKLLEANGDFSKDWDNAVAKDILSKNKSSISGFLAIAQRPKYQDPKYSDADAFKRIGAPEDQYPVMAKLVQLDAFYRAKNGNAPAGRQEALLLAAYGHKMSLSLFDTDGYKRALDMKNAGLVSLERLVALFPPTGAEAKGLDTQLAALGDTAAGLAEDLKFEYVVGKKELLAGIAGGELDGLVGASNAKNPFLFEQNKTLNMVAGTMRNLVTTVGTACTLGARVQEKSQPTEGEMSALRKMDTENAIGNFIIASLPDYSSELNYRCDDVAKVNAIRASLAATMGAK
jgi:hypothetical protein